MTHERCWKKRAEQRLTQAERDSAPYLRKIAAQYREAARSIEEDVRKVLDTYRRDFTVEEAKAFLREEIPMAEYSRLKALLPQIQDEQFRKELTMRLNAQSYRYRITRMQYIRQLILARLSQAADYEKQASAELYRETAKEGYLHTLFDIQKGVGIGFSVAMLPEKTIDRLERARWYGRNYSASVWRNRGLVAKAAADVVETGILTGQDIQRMTRKLMTQTYTHSVSNAARLIRTEVNYFSNQGAYESYEEAGIEAYEYLATLDGRTSQICQRLDGKRFSMDEAEPGKNYPPMHPYCRSTTIPIIDAPGLKHMEKRAARDPKTGKTVVVDDMTYEQWKNWQEGLANHPQNAIIESEIRKAGNFAGQAKIHLQPRQIDTDTLGFDDVHINQERNHQVSKEDAIRWIHDAKISVTVWEGRYERYYGAEGASYVDLKNNLIRTAYGKVEFQKDVRGILEVLKKHGLLS